MNLDKIESKFSKEMLTAIKLEVEAFVQSRFTLDDYSVNQYLIDTFFVQPVYYATLLNYYTIYEQRSTISLSEIYLDDSITLTKKDTYMQSFADSIGVDTAGMTANQIVSAIENKLTVSDSKIHSDMMDIVRSYPKAIDGTTGVFWSMFRNSPDHMYFINERFSAVVMSENLSMTIPFPALLDQPITLSDISRYNNISNAGRVTNCIDIYVAPSVNSNLMSITTPEGTTKTYTLPARKYSKIKVPEADNVIECTRFEGGYMGFPSRSLDITVTGPFTGSIEYFYYQDTPATEDTIETNNATYDIAFFGLIPIDLEITLQNKNGLSKVIEYLKTPIQGSAWVPKMEELTRTLSKSSNSIVSMDAVVWLNPLISKKIPMYNNKLTVGTNSIFSWIDIGNAALSVTKITDAGTGNVTAV